MIKGIEKIYLSIDELLRDSQSASYPVELLNTLTISGLPPHKLILKVETLILFFSSDIKIFQTKKPGMPVILLRNIQFHVGLCNGTRLICRNFYSRVIAAEVINGPLANQIVFIPRIPMIPTDTGLPFEFSRLQFPIRPAFAITINKCKNQYLFQLFIYTN